MANLTQTSALVGADIGGTFTDLVWLDNEGNVHTKKIPSTPEDYSAAVIDGVGMLLETIGAEARRIRRFCHGTTLATNAIIEKTGARVALVTTSGFRDVLEIARIRTPYLYDITWSKPEPLVPREMRFEVNERIAQDGSIVSGPEDSELDALVDLVERTDPEAIAISFINAYANGDHERKVAKRFEQRLPKIPISISSEVLPEIREYERTSTTVANSYLRPVVEAYLEKIEVGLRGMGLDSSMLVMQSNGGAMSLAGATKNPVHIVESGPAAGVVACAAWAAGIGLENVITLDMGGTTAKASLIQDGGISYTQELELRPGITAPSRLIKGGGYVIRTPAIDLSEVGAGGGSIAKLDAAGALQVGPESAGAIPGPVCYMQGGDEPTVTDANVSLGFLNPATLVGGEMTIDSDAAARAIHDRIARPLGMDLNEASHGVHTVANARMIRAIKHVTTERGRDPRQLTLFVFGGSGPVHGALMARSMGIHRVVIPPLPGLFSALGLLFAQMTRHYVQTYLEPVSSLDRINLEQVRGHLLERAVRDLGADGYSSDQLEFLISLGMRYSGQRSEIELPLADISDWEVALSDLVSRFHEQHQHLYGHKDEREPVEIATVRLRATVAQEDSNLVSAWSGRWLESDAAVEANDRKVYFGSRYGYLNTSVIDRAALRGGAHDGPLIVEDYGSTTVVPPRSSASLDEMGAIVIQMTD